MVKVESVRTSTARACVSMLLSASNNCLHQRIRVWLGPTERHGARACSKDHLRLMAEVTSCRQLSLSSTLMRKL
eukprot:COSAG02_NODE_78_length_40609_cov_19.893730_16_plen_74_part_00